MGEITQKEDHSEQINMSELPKLADPPAGITIEKPLKVDGNTASSNIYLGKGPGGEQIIFDIAKDPSKIPYVQAKYDFLTSNLSSGSPVQDFTITRPISNYLPDSRLYAGYKSTTRLVHLYKHLTSRDMYDSGQIAEEYVTGVPLIYNDAPNNKIQTEIKKIAILSYTDFLGELEKKGVRIDPNLTDIFLNMDTPETFQLIKVDASPENIAMQGVAASTIAAEISTFFSEEIPEFEKIRVKFKQIPLGKKTYKELNNMLVKSLHKKSIWNIFR